MEYTVKYACCSKSRLLFGISRHKMADVVLEQMESLDLLEDRSSMKRSTLLVLIVQGQQL